MIVLHDKLAFGSVTIRSCSVTILGHVAWHNLVSSHKYFKSNLSRRQKGTSHLCDQRPWRGWLGSLEKSCNKHIGEIWDCPGVIKLCWLLLVLLEEHDVLLAGQVEKKVTVWVGSDLDLTSRWIWCTERI